MQNPIVTKLSSGKQQVAAFMDDFKIHAPTKKSADAISQAIKEAAEELGLSLNLRKCGIYSRDDEVQVEQQSGEEEEAEEDIPFLPTIREGYKYLGLQQLERDTLLNMKKVQELVTTKTEESVKTKLSPAQKIMLLNSTVIPAAVYITANLYPNESRASTLKKCRELDKSIRKILIQENLFGKTSTRTVCYLSTTFGGIGLKSIKFETEIQYLKIGLYLQQHPDMQETKNRFERLVRAGWRNPLTDAEYVMKEYDQQILPKNESESLSDYIRQITKCIAGKQQHKLLQDWTGAMHYARLVKKEYPSIKLPAYSDLRLNDWEYTLLRKAAEEQIHGL